MTEEGLDLRGLLEFQDNRRCIDCGTGKSEYVLIDFGGFVCKTCFLLHSDLGLKNKLQHITDPITDQDLKQMVFGGNSALYEYWEVYDLNYKAISFKYLTLSAVYYKEMLASLRVNGNYYRDFLSLEKAKQLSQQSFDDRAPEPEPRPQKLKEKIEEAWEKLSLTLSDIIKTIKTKLKIHP